MNREYLDDFMSFRTFVSTSWLKSLYKVGILSITMGSIVAYRIADEQGEGGWGLILGLVYFVAGNIVWRIVCEFGILFFSMHEQLVIMAKESERRSRSLSVASMGGTAAGPQAQPHRHQLVAATSIGEADQGVRPGSAQVGHSASGSSKVECRFCGERTSVDTGKCHYCGRPIQ